MEIFQRTLFFFAQQGLGLKAGAKIETILLTPNFFETFLFICSDTLYAKGKRNK